MKYWGNNVSLPERQRDGRLVAGICVSLGTRLRLDVTLVRFAFVLLGLAWGLGLILYGLLWLLMPIPDVTSTGRPDRVFRRTARGMHINLGNSTKWFSKKWRRVERTDWSKQQNRKWMAIGLVTAGTIIFLASIGAFNWLNGTRAFGLAIVTVGASLILVTRRKD